jgi:hypothetical protein
MNPFEEFLRVLFNRKTPESELPAPNAYPRYKRGPVTSVESSPEAWDRRLASPLADSLKALGPMFQPNPSVRDRGPQAAMGYVDYAPGREARFPIGMGFNTDSAAYGPFMGYDQQEEESLARYRQSPAGFVFDPRRVMIHEYGHLANSHGGAFPGYSEVSKMFSEVRPRDFKREQNLFYKKISANTPSDYKAFATVDPYYRINPQEAFAQAFVNAWEFLQETKADPKMDYRKFAGDLEANTPGMGMIVRDLLKDPQFKNHPLRGKIFNEEKKK